MYIMSDLENFVYVPRIAPSEANARSLQELTLQDVLAGDFSNPTNLADPDNPDMVSTQQNKLRQFPEKYAAYTDQYGTIVAYMKSAEWLAGDEAPFVKNVFARHLIKMRASSRGGSLTPTEYGVFGLVGSDALANQERHAVLHDLLQRSLGKAALISATAVNIVLHDHDPATPVALGLGFRSTGDIGEASGAPGLKQPRYRLSIK